MRLSSCFSQSWAIDDSDGGGEAGGEGYGLEFIAADAVARRLESPSDL